MAQTPKCRERKFKTEKALAKALASAGLGGVPHEAIPTETKGNNGQPVPGYKALLYVDTPQQAQKARSLGFKATTARAEHSPTGRLSPTGQPNLQTLTPNTPEGRALKHAASTWVRGMVYGGGTVTGRFKAAKPAEANPPRTDDHLAVPTLEALSETCVSLTAAAHHAAAGAYGLAITAHTNAGMGARAQRATTMRDMHLELAKAKAGDAE